MTTARDRLLDGAVTLTRSRGVAGTTVSDLLAEAGVARRSLYLNFPGGRDELIATAIEHRGEEMMAALQQLFAAVPDFLEAMDAYLALQAAELVASDFTEGCPIVAAALGGAEVPLAREAAGRIFVRWQAAIADALRVSGVPDDEAPELAALVLSSAEGATAMAIARRSTAPLEQVGTLMRRLVAAALPGAPD
jgi:TetR/AcrR family transcriptional repressor of lmrAB and yxaGH operons